MADKIKNEYKNGKKVVTFPDGKVKEVKKEEMEFFKQHLVRKRDDIDRQLTYVDADLAEMGKSKQVIVE